ncbi:diguanylate cyclase domain-containing protein [Kineococcus gynurae]|uniref:Diguanylate cyclase domain-containing protein n=1 Tax=Kineococcus gynurae TaxID=452979 RepID=A0ABV5LSP2_9ACTN
MTPAAIDRAGAWLRLRLDAPAACVYLITCSGIIAVGAILGLQLLGLPVVRPGTEAAPLLGAALLVLGAVIHHRRLRAGQQAGVGWSYLLLVAGLCFALPVAQPGLRSLIALAFVIAPVYAALFDTWKQVVGVACSAVTGSAVVVLTGPGLLLERLLVALCAALVMLPITASLLLLRSRLDEACGRADALSRRDPLTGLLNRRGLDHELPLLLDRASAPGRHLAVVVADVDHFKRINDDLGHEAGDDVLRRLGGLLAGFVGEDEVAARWGGEELVLVAVLRPERLRGLAEAVRTTVRTSIPGRQVTVSVGAASSPVPSGVTRAIPSADRAADLFTDTFRRADRLLLDAKEAGRDVSFSELHVPPGLRR